MEYVVVRGSVGPNGKAPWRVVESDWCGNSRQPITDACRKIIASGGDPAAQVYLKVEGRDDWFLRVVCGDGARLMVSEPKAGNCRLVPFKEREFPDE